MKVVVSINGETLPVKHPTARTCNDIFSASEPEYECCQTCDGLSLIYAEGFGWVRCSACQGWGTVPRK